MTRLPDRGEPAAVLLSALVRAFPNTVWSPTVELGVPASRCASALRRLGLEVESVHKPTADGRVWGYRLARLPRDWRRAREPWRSLFVMARVRQRRAAA